MKKFFLLFLIILSSVSLLNIVPSQGAKVSYYGYTESGTSYYRIPEPFSPYWETTYRGRTVKIKTAEITISVEGLSTEYSTYLLVNGKVLGTLQGGESAKFQIKGDEKHSFQVQSYVEERSGERFYCEKNSWTSEKGEEVEVDRYGRYFLPLYWWWDYPYNWWRYYPYYRHETETVVEPFDQIYTFHYEAEYELTVENEFGGGTTQAGWYRQDSTVTLSTKPVIQKTGDTRYIFDAWTLNGVDVTNEQVTFKMDKPYSALAKYLRQYYLELKSYYGSPQGSGWYTEGEIAVIEVERLLPVEGFWGNLGAIRIFERWSGEFASQNPLAEVPIDSAKIVVANWMIDKSTPYTILLILVIVVIVIIAVVSLWYWMHRPSRKVMREKRVTDLVETLKIRYAKGELTRKDYLQMKQDLEIDK